MPFPMKIQPIDSHTLPEDPTRFEPVKQVAKSRLKRLFERQFTSVLRISVAEKAGADEPHFAKDGFNGSGEFEPSSVCLAKMVQNFIEECNDKTVAPPRCGRNRCNCFNGGCNDCSVDELDSFCGFGDSSFVNSGEACEILKVTISYLFISFLAEFEFACFRKRSAARCCCCCCFFFLISKLMFGCVAVRVWCLAQVFVKGIC